MKAKIESIVAEIGQLVHFKVEDGNAHVHVELKGKVNPLVGSVKRALKEIVSSEGLELNINLIEPQTAKKPEAKKYNGTEGIKRVIAVTSGKGGVGKSSVAAAIARSLALRGESVGVLDADIYGPSQPKLFGLEGVAPIANDNDTIEPPISTEGIKVISIGFFVSSSDALVWRGPMATSALKQLIHQTNWGPLDTLVIDMPPGTGDIHLSIANELKITEALIVTTPSELALSDVVRGVSMLKNENIAVPILGIINNMAYFTPEDAPEKRYRIFGDDQHLREVAQSSALEILVEIPITGVVGAPIDPTIFNDIF